MTYRVTHREGMAMDRMRLYDIIYALAATGGREKALFGNCGSAAREAFERSLTEDGFPELWFELPLAGEPWLDFHALASYGEVVGTEAAFAGHGGAYADALAWFAGQEPGRVRQLALSYDTSMGNVDNPAVQLLVGGPDPSTPLAFLEAAGRPDLCSAYAGFIKRIPPAWYACYTGVFPGRDAAGADPWVRVECIVGDGYQQAYASDASVLQEHLRRIGLRTIVEDVVPGIQELARTPFPLELQFNVGPDGVALPALSASVRFQPDDWANAARREQIGQLASWMQARGLADARCGLLAQTAFAKRVKHAGETVTISCFPAFVKLRWRSTGTLSDSLSPQAREGLLPDAKAYLMARAD